ncbi:ATP-binding protein [Halotia wernerae UHCC 0503]|nr:ATP-binding protein [Halotia wernerae UHCC 0503]
MNIENEWEWVKISNGEWAAVAKYRDHLLPEYNTNPIIRSLPPILSQEKFVEYVTRLPACKSSERELEPQYRFHCIERLSRYFDPLNKTVDLQRVVCVLIMQGYLRRNPLQPEYALRSGQIYQAVLSGGGFNLEEYVDVPTSASGLTIIGPSGIGKTTNLLNILSLYPQVIVHPAHSVYQIVWLKVDCPHAGSLKGLCIDFFRAVDKLLGTNNFQKFGVKRNSEDYMLAQVAQIAHTQHLGVLVIDEMQNLAAARRNSHEMLNFLVKMDNIIGVPVIRVGTNEAFPILQGNFRNARRGVGEGGVIWDRMENNREWNFFIEGMWEFQWTKQYIPLTTNISSALYYESQGIIDIVIKLYKMVQWRAIALGTEVITVDLIHACAADGLHLVKPMLDAIRSGDEKWMMKYKDIAPLDVNLYRNKCLNFLEERDLEAVRRLARSSQRMGNISATLRYVIIELINLDVLPITAKSCAEKIIAFHGEDADKKMLIKEAYKLALQCDTISTEPGEHREIKTKLQPKYQENDIRAIVENAKKNQTPACEELKALGIIKDPLTDFFTSG